MNIQNISLATHRECVQYAMKEGTVVNPTPAASNQTTRRGSAIDGRDKIQAVPDVAARRAERKTNAELLRAPADRERQDAVHAEGT